MDEVIISPTHKQLLRTKPYNSKAGRTLSPLYSERENPCQQAPKQQRMASIGINQPLSTPAHEWAADTASALQTASSPGADSQASTPGAQFPGAFPGGLYPQPESSNIEEKTPHVAAKHLADAAPEKSSSELQESAKGYLPNVDVQKALETAKAYLPQSVVGAVGSVLPSGVTNGQTERDIDPTSGAKPTSIDSSPSGSESVDKASTTVIPPSTRSGSFTSSITEGERTPSTVAANRELGGTLDITSQAKPNVPPSAPSAVSVPSVSDTPVAPASNSAAKSPSNTLSTAVTGHSLPTPPPSDKSSPNDVHSGGKQDAVPAPEKPNLREEDDGPTPPRKDDSSENTRSTQPRVSATPAQAHVKSGTAVGAHLPGTTPAGGDGAPSSISPKSEISSPHVGDDDAKDPRREEDISGISRDASTSSSDEGNGTEGKKKEGRVKKVVHKVKDKLSHRNH